MPGVSTDLDEARDCLRRDPQRSLAISQRYLSEHPDDPNGLYSRFQAWWQLGEHERARADIDRVLELEPNSGGYSVRGQFFHSIGDYQNAVADMTRARELDEEEWRTSLDPRYRADSLARLGRLDEALADCAFICEDQQMPAFDDLPGGNKQQFTDEIKRRAFLARSKKG